MYLREDVHLLWKRLGQNHTRPLIPLLPQARDGVCALLLAMVTTHAADFTCQTLAGIRCSCAHDTGKIHTRHSAQAWPQNCLDQNFHIRIVASQRILHTDRLKTLLEPRQVPLCQAWEDQDASDTPQDQEAALALHWETQGNDSGTSKNQDPGCAFRDLPSLRFPNVTEWEQKLWARTMLGPEDVKMNQSSQERPRQDHGLEMGPAWMRKREHDRGNPVWQAETVGSWQLAGSCGRIWAESSTRKNNN